MRRWSEPTSSLSASLLRLVLPLVCWAEFGESALPFVRPTGTQVMVAVGFFASTTWMLLGWGGRSGTVATGVVLGAMTFGLGAAGYEEDWYHHHTTLLAFVVIGLAFSPVTGHLSVDRWLELRRSGDARPAARGPSLGLGLVALTVSTVYFWGAFDKCHPAFLDGTRLTSILLHVWGSSDWWFPSWAAPLAATAAVVTVVLEYALAFGFWIPRVRAPLMALGVAMHAAFYLLLPVGSFSVAMVTCYLAFLEPDDVERAFWRLLGRPPAA